MLENNPVRIEIHLTFQPSNHSAFQQISQHFNFLTFQHFNFLLVFRVLYVLFAKKYLLKWLKT
jgi:hypothetical protein